MPSPFSAAVNHLLLILPMASGAQPQSRHSRGCVFLPWIRKLQGRIPAVLGCITAGLCVCDGPHPLDLHHQDGGRSISPKEGYTVKNRRERPWERQITRLLADHCFATQYTNVCKSVYIHTPYAPSHCVSNNRAFLHMTHIMHSM